MGGAATSGIAGRGLAKIPNRGIAESSMKAGKDPQWSEASAGGSAFLGEGASP